MANCKYNAEKIIELIDEAQSKGIEFIVFPELSITSYSCGDLFYQEALIKEAYNQLSTILEYTANLDMVVIAGIPLRVKNQLFSSGVVMHGGKILGAVPKCCIRNGKGYSEGRWFSSGNSVSLDISDITKNMWGQYFPFGKNLLFNYQIGENLPVSFSLELGSDIQMVLPPSSYHSIAGADIIFNLSAVMEETGLYEYRKDLVRLQSGKCSVAYVYTSAGVNESTTDGVFGGYAVISENGTVLEESKRFKMESQMIYADIDIDKIKSEKVKNNCFTDKNLVAEDMYKNINFSNASHYKVSSNNISSNNIGSNNIGSNNIGSNNINISANCKQAEFIKLSEKTGLSDNNRLDESNMSNESNTSNEPNILNETDASYKSDNSDNSDIPNSIPERPQGIILKRHIDPYPFIPADKNIKDERYTEILDIQTWGLAMRILNSGLKRGIIGISGGLDSTLALLVAAKAFDKLGLPRKDIIAITMPGFGTTDTTFNSSLQLIESVGASFRKIDIKQACLQHFKDIGHDVLNLDTTYENVQARERTQILMDIANKEHGLVIGTGDLSELALGWCTYNGDHMSMYDVNAGVPKTLIKSLLFWAAGNMDENIIGKDIKEILYQIIDTPITPELLPPNKEGKIKQKTEDIVGPYELHDFFIYHVIRYGTVPEKVLFLAEQAFKDRYTKEEIKKWLKVFYKRFFTQQFKRSCMPDGPKVGTISLSPRGGWMMPSDVQALQWLK